MKKLILVGVIIANLFLASCAKSSFPDSVDKEIVTHNQNNIFN